MRQQIPYKYPGYDTPVWIDVYNRMYRERIMFLSQGIGDDLANTIIAVLLYLESENANDPVAMYCNCPGGLTKSGLAVYDTMRSMPYDIQTVNMGMCAHVGAFIVGGGTKGKRYALPNSRFYMMNPQKNPVYDNEGNPRVMPMQVRDAALAPPRALLPRAPRAHGRPLTDLCLRRACVVCRQATEMKVEVEEILRDKKVLLEGYSRFTGRSMDLMKTDFKRDFYLAADEAIDYGLIDKILGPKNPDKSQDKSAVQFGAFGGKEEQRVDGLDLSPAGSAPSPPAGGDEPPPQQLLFS